MRRRRQLALFLLAIAVAGSLRAADVIDRVVATVGKHAILQSELDDSVRFEMFSAGRQLNAVTDEDVKAALTRLIDRQLILDDTGESDAFAPTAEDVQKRLTDIRSQVPGCSTEEGWRSILGEYGLQDETVREMVRSQLETARIVNQKLRPSARVTQAEIDAAYRDEFLPKIKQAGGKEAPLSELSSRIRQVLVERHISELLTTWLQGLHSQADIQVNLDELKSDNPRLTSDHASDSANSETKNIQ